MVVPTATIIFMAWSNPLLPAAYNSRTASPSEFSEACDRSGMVRHRLRVDDGRWRSYSIL